MAKPEVIVSPKAERDVSVMLLESHRRWGRRQMEIYAAEFESALERLQDFPESGHVDARLRKKQRLLHFGSHTIIYSVKDGDIHVARVLHQTMDVRKHR